MPRFFGAKLRYLRNQRGFTQTELAGLLSLASYTYIHRLETNQRSPALLLVLRIAGVLEVSTDYFLRDSVPIESIIKADHNLVGNQNSLAKLFGARLKSLRYQFGWTQNELARKLGIARQGYISNLEGGRKLPSIELVLQIADLFEVTTDYLLVDDITMIPKHLD